MIQKLHLFLMMFTKCSLRVTSAYSGRSHKKKFTLWWILPGFTFSTITNSTCQPIFGIHNFTIPIKYQSDFKNINWNDPKVPPVSHDVYPVFPWCWSNLDHRVYRGVVTREVHLMMDPTRIHTSPLSSNQYAKQPLVSRTFKSKSNTLASF